MSSDDSARKRSSQPPRLTLLTAANISCKPIRWLWPGWLARGKFHLLAGAPGTGKTTIALSLAAAISAGKDWPDSNPAPVGNVLIWSGEDDPGDTLVPRLRAAGADLHRTNVVGSVSTIRDSRPFDPATDLLLLEEAAAAIGNVSLLIVDPVVNVMGAGDSHKNIEVRRALQPLVDLCARMDCALLGITHFSKGSGGRDPTERVNGSIAFGALPRVVMATAKGAQGDESAQRVLVRSKSNIGPDGGGFSYEIGQISVGEDLEASVIRWTGGLDGTAQQLLDEVEDHIGSPRQEAADWLCKALSNGPVPVSTLKVNAKAAGIAWRTIQNAKAEIGVVAERMSSGNRGSGYWAWSLGDKVRSATAQLLPQNLALLRSCEDLKAPNQSSAVDFERPQEIGKSANLSSKLRSCQDEAPESISEQLRSARAQERVTGDDETDRKRLKEKILSRVRVSKA